MTLQTSRPQYINQVKVLGVILLQWGTLRPEEDADYYYMMTSPNGTNWTEHSINLSDLSI